jgi:magnesium-protoporphyrin O-methyltransferase
VEKRKIMSTCQCQGIETRFDRKHAAGRLKEYRRNGPKETTRQLIAALQAEGFAGMTLLDIGGGVGDIQHEMLRQGLSHATDCEASTAYLEACRQEAERLGHSTQINHLQGNFVELAKDIPPADIVTLDRVLCCFNDMYSLVNLSAQKAKRFYGIVYPIDRWWTRLGLLLTYNFLNWLQRNPMRMFVHPTEAVEAVIKSNGLTRCFFREMGVWQVAVYSRS